MSDAIIEATIGPCGLLCPPGHMRREDNDCTTVDCSPPPPWVFDDGINGMNVEIKNYSVIFNICHCIRLVKKRLKKTIT